MAVSGGKEAALLEREIRLPLHILAQHEETNVEMITGGKPNGAQGGEVDGLQFGRVSSQKDHDGVVDAFQKPRQKVSSESPCGHMTFEAPEREGTCRTCSLGPRRSSSRARQLARCDRICGARVMQPEDGCFVFYRGGFV